VVRIELRNPPPPVNFTEWDGLVRLLFNRKHKVLHAVLTTKTVLALLEENFRTFHALHSLPLPEPMPDIKAVVEEVVGLEQFKDKRAAKMDLDDFLALLAEFNSRSIHFA
jgi:18S rRNA (adenine1779-N6/adenine1780-N6)-dimethyltransferase